MLITKLEGDEATKSWSGLDCELEGERQRMEEI